MKKIVELIYQNKKLFLILFLIITAITIPFLLKIGISNSLNIWFPKGDPLLKSYDNFLQNYGNDETIIIGLKSKNSFTSSENLTELSGLLHKLNKIEGTGDAIWFGTPFVSTEFRDILISNDSLKTLVIIPMSNKSDFGDTRQRIIDSITGILKTTDYEYHLAGMGVIYDGLNKATRHNGFIFIMFSFLFIFIFLILFLRDWRILFISLLSITTSTIILFSVYSLIDKDINIITIVLPVLILIYGISDIIYIVYGIKSSNSNDMITTLSQIFPPCFLTSLTTAIGFFSLLASKITAVRQIGLYGGIGVLIEFLATLIVMIYFSDRIKKSRRTPVILNGIHDFETHFVDKHYGSVIFIFFLILAVFGYGIRYLNIDTFTINMLRGKNTVKTDSDWIEKNLGYYLPLELLVKIDNPNDKNSKIAIDSFRNNIKEKYGYNSLSYYDINIPLFALLSGGNKINLKYYNPRNRKLRITVYVPILSAKQIGSVKDSVIGTFRKYSNLPVEVSGYIPLYIKIIDYITNSQFKSFPIALITIFLFITLIFGLKNGILAILPNLLPIVIVLGTMGYFKIALDLGTVIITPIIIGVVVDDTIHYIFARKNATQKMVRHPMLVTSILLTLGFLICVFANITTIAYFGLLSSIAIFSAYFGDAILLPSLFRVFRR